MTLSTPSAAVQYGHFIGRELQLQTIRERIERIESRSLIFIEGSGGVGKTWLLHKIYSEYHQRTDIVAFPTIDFSQTKTRTIRWLMDTLMTEARKWLSDHADIQWLEAFGEYQRLQQSMAQRGRSSGALAAAQDELETAFRNDLRDFAQARRCLFCFDTLELIQDTTLLDFVLELFGITKHSIFLLAGRPGDRLSSYLGQHVPPQSLVPIQLVGFSEPDALFYIQHHPAGANLSKDEQRTLYLLADEGVPIKLALALDWLLRGLVMRTLLNYSYPELLKIRKEDPKQFDQIELQFERELVTQIARLGTDVDRTIHLMGHVHKRFNRELLALLIPDVKTEAVVEQLKALGFVKFIEDDYFVLHDEIQRMIVRHIWDWSDSTRETRRTINQKVIDFYSNKLKQLEDERRKNDLSSTADDWGYQVYEIERLHYQLDLNLTHGYAEFIRIFQPLQENRKTDAAALALDVLVRDRPMPNRLRDFVSTYYRGWVLVRRLSLSAACKILHDGLKQLEANNPSKEVEFKEADFLTREVDQRLGEVYTLLGYCYRLLGDWDEAVKYYERGRELIEKLIDTLHKDEHRDEQLIRRSTLGLAETVNDIANLKRMQGSLAEARLYCKTSLLIRENLGAIRQAGNSCYVMGMVMWESGNTAEAMSYLERAREYYRKTGNTILERAWIDRYEGYVMYRSGDVEEAVQLLNRAHDAVYDNPALRDEYAEILLYLSRINLDRNTAEARDQAMEQARSAQMIAQQIHNDYRIAESYLTLCRIARGMWVADPTDPKLQRQYKTYLDAGLALATSRKYRRLEVVFADIQGDLAFESRNYPEAFHKYIQACLLGIEFKPAVFTRAASRLTERLYQLIKEDPNEAFGICQSVLQRIVSSTILDEEYPELKLELGYLKELADNARERQSIEHRFQNAFRKGLWDKAQEQCDRADTLPVYLHPDRATAFHHRAEVYFGRNQYALARVFSERAVHIRQEYAQRSEGLGDSYVLLSRIYWRLANTAEAAAYLTQASKQYSEIGSEVGLAQINLEKGYIAFRKLQYKEAKRYFTEARLRFKQLRQPLYEASALNFISWSARSAPTTDEEREIHYREAEGWAEEAIEILGDQDIFVAAELNLTLCILHYMWGLYLHKAGRAQESKAHIDQSWHYREQGWQRLQNVTSPMLFSVYYDMWANLYALEGNFERVRENYFHELEYAVQTKHMRLINALDLLENWLVNLDPGATQEHGQWLIEAWNQSHLAKKHPQIAQALQWIVDHRRFLQASRES